MIEQPLTIDEFMDAIEPELASQVDRLILSEQDPADRLFLLSRRGEILDELRAATRRANEQLLHRTRLH